MPYHAILFDLDGTLIDTAADFVATIQQLCKNHGIESPDSRSIRNTVSDGARALVRLAFQLDEADPKIEDLRQELLNIYEVELGKSAPLFPEMSLALEKIQSQSIPWGIVTNKPRKYTELLLERIQLSVPAVVCPCDVSEAKPNPEGLLLAAKKLNVSPEQCLYFGDHERDIVAGKAANMATAACSWGYISDPAVVNHWQADVICHTANDAVTALHLER